jgi:DNA-binding NarL/FixJ family response regulator
MDQRLTPQLLAWVQDGTRTAPRERVDDCSIADRRILSLIAAGQSNKEIARELNVTPGAVTARLRAVYKGVEDLKEVEAVRYFVQWEQDCLGVGIARSNNHFIMVSHRSNT